MGRVLSPDELAGSTVVEAAPAVEDRGPATSQGAAVLHSGLQGATLGFEDELQGVGGAVGETIYNLVNNGRLPTGKELKAAYTDNRDEERGRVANARRDFPKTALASEIAGGLLVPIPGGGAAGAAKGAATAARATGIGAKALAAAKAVAPAAAQGAAWGLGAQENGQGNVASIGEDAGAAAKGAAAGVAASAATKVAGKALGKTYMWFKNKLHRGPEEIKSAILDEIATTADGKQITPTAKKRLQKASDAIYDELVTGPDGKVVQKAFTAKTAKEGLATLTPHIDKLNAQRDAVYEIFEKSGKSNIDVAGDYVPRLVKAAKRARIGNNGKGADPELAAGLEGAAEAIADEARRTVADGGRTNMEWLRSQVSTLQRGAASKLGGLNEHETSKMSRHIAEEAKGVLDDVFASNAKGNPALEEAADSLRGINRRLYANITAQGALEDRAIKEGIGKGPVRTALNKAAGLKAAATSGAGALLGSAVAGPVGGVVGGLAGAAVPSVADAIDRRLTTNAIDRLRVAAQGQGKEGAWQAIKSVAKEYGVPENVVRNTYVRLLVGGPQEQQ